MHPRTHLRTSPPSCLQVGISIALNCLLSYALFDVTFSRTAALGILLVALASAVYNVPFAAAPLASSGKMKP